MSTEKTVAKSHVEMGIPLATMIQTLRRELQAAQADGSGADLRFQIEKVDLELEVAISRTKKGTGEIEFWVVNAGGEFEKTTETTHNISLSLKPISRDPGGHLLVNAKTGERVSED